MTNPLHHSAGNFGVPGSDHLQAVCPTLPVRGVACPLLPKPIPPNVKGMVAASMQRLYLEHFTETLEDLLVVSFSKLEGEFRMPLSSEKKFARVDAQYNNNNHAACTSCTWGIISSSRSCSIPFLGQEVLNVVRVSHWCSQHFEASLSCGQSLISPLHHRLWIVYARCCRQTYCPCCSMPAAFHTFVLLKWMLMYACL